MNVPTEPASDDASLLKRYLQHGDAEAMALLFRRHSDTAYRVALRCCGNPNDAEDAVQTAYLKVLRDAGQFLGNSSVRGWIMSIVVNSSRVKNREEAARRKREASVMEGQANASEPSDEKAEVASAALNAVQSLPELYRLPVWLHYVEGFGFDEVAGTLAVKEKTAREQVRRGLEQVRQALAASGFASGALATPELLGKAALPAAPAALTASLSALIASAGVVKGSAAGAAAAAGKTAGSTVSLLGTSAMKIGACVLLTVAAATAVVVSNSKGDPAETAKPAPKEEKIAGGEKPAAPKGNDKAPLGSPDFYPSPEHPIGWRGDGTGRFPGATPPTQWARRIKGPLSELKYQAKKPQGEPGADAKPLEYYAVRDWLVAGPFTVADAAKDIATDYVGGEAAADPDIDAKAGESTWKFVHVAMENQTRHGENDGQDLSVDFTCLLGIGSSGASIETLNENDVANKAAYAACHLYAPRDSTVRLQIPFRGTACRFWVNGKLTDAAPPSGGWKSYEVALNRGWNRLLIKVVTAKGIKDPTGHRMPNWSCAAIFLPSPPVAYETRNIPWMTKLPGLCASQPIVVGENLYTCSGLYDLVCIGKADGRIKWLKSNAYCEILTVDEKKAIEGYETKIEPLHKKLSDLNQKVVQEINAAVSPQGLSPEQTAAIDKIIKEKKDTEAALAKAFKAIDGKRFGFYGEQTNSTPCSDGSRIYVACSERTTIFACYDLDGNRIWSHTEEIGTTEHGNNSSPVLSEGKLIYAASHTRLALDAKTGQVAWKGDISFNCNAHTPLITRIGGVSVVAHAFFLCRVSDGVELCPFRVDPWGDFTPAVENGVSYSPSSSAGGHPKHFYALKLPDHAEPGAKAAVEWKADPKETFVEIRGVQDYMIASPLFVDGLVYSVTMGGMLSVNDVAAKKNAYKLFVDGHNRYNRGLFGFSASPVFAGGRVYLTDGVGYTHLIEPGRTFKETGANVLENQAARVMCWGGAPGNQEEFYTSPWFEGNTMYLRGTDYLYCIREAK